MNIVYNNYINLIIIMAALTPVELGKKYHEHDCCSKVIGALSFSTFIVAFVSGLIALIIHLKIEGMPISDPDYANLSGKMWDLFTVGFIPCTLLAIIFLAISLKHCRERDLVRADLESRDRLDVL
jgi:hypothetical protein